MLVTGASRGIGAAIAREFAARGARVSLAARSAGPLDELAAELDGYALPCDLFDAAQVNGLVGRAEAAAGPVDVLVNNAGMEYTKSFFDTTEAEIDDVVRLNLTVPMQLTRMVLPGMRERNRGHVLNISSMAANGGFPGLAVYCGTKSGLSHFGRILLEDLHGSDVKVTTLEVARADRPARPARVPADGEVVRPTPPPAVMPNVSAERVARAAADGVERGKRAVWPPRRAFLFGALVGAPQRIVRPLIAGVR
ncbi:MAG: SDR family NAD(P)-dependent oxidoreductase [Ilumatobacteraceae bacterium]